MNAKILIIDDSEDIHDLLNYWLADEAYFLLHAYDGISGITIATSKQPDLILVDISMPDTSGFDVCQQLKAIKLTQDIPVVFLSGKKESVDKIKGLDLGAVDYITKPVDPAELKARIRSILRTRMLEISLRENAQQLENLNQQLQTEIHERQELFKKLQYLAHYDSLTGLANRIAFYDNLKNSMAMARRKETYVGLIYLDLNKFKPVNDQYGHDAGDIVLKKAAKSLLSCVREYDTVARLGGDEFGVVIGDLNQKEDIEVVTNRIHERLKKPIDIQSGHSVTIGCSIGVSFYPDDSLVMDELVKLADTAMYKAKVTRNN